MRAAVVRAGILALTESEGAQFAELEATIERGLTTFVEVGAALATIRDARLYRGEFDTFDDYCDCRWRMRKSQAYRLIDASEVAMRLSPMGEITERHVRPLTHLEPAQQRQAWHRAEEIAEAEGVPVRARHVEAAVQERRPRAPKYDIEKPTAETLIDSWRVELVSVTDAVEDTLTCGLKTKARDVIWNEAAQPMIRELQKLNPARGK